MKSFAGRKSDTKFWPDADLPPGTIGAAAELTVALEMLARGYYVFRSITPNSPCDLVVMRRDDGCVARVEVRTGCFTPAGQLALSVKESDACDIYAVAVNDDVVFVRPAGRRTRFDPGEFVEDIFNAAEKRGTI